ncbi:leucine-rich repeat protein [Plasmodium gallinaceum]|uniref:Leucine-rich repeat protein n=1 Tax=Plasmodium gallinaceum TaxID=5849 RepID=A0A1J1GTJ0_PLAGA|nr:leucine-rich repeat protein [Plasmodium gallinaceum]CRG95828.1 leucine-rich repeat protein [Plasmodium gallinaceum]
MHTRNYVKLIKFCNNVEFKKNEEIEKLEVCMEKYINLNIFHYFINIKELYLVKNNITHITPLFKCVNLIILFLQINKIKSILGIEKLTKLEKLNLFNNDLTEKYIKIDENKSLTYIDLSDNKIENIDFFNNTNSFIHINLANNNIKNIDSLKNNLNLEYLNISGNKIEKFEDIEILHDLKKIKELYLNSIYYRNNILTDGILYKHYFFSRFPNLRILDHEVIKDKHRKITDTDLEILKNIMDFKINFIEEKYKKEKYYILFINNKNVSYLNDVLKPFNFYYNLKEIYTYDERENEKISKIEKEIKYLINAYTIRFNYIMNRLKEERNLQIRYIITSLSSYFNIFFKIINREEEEKIENLLKLNFHPQALKNYFIDDIKIESIIKVKKLSHSILNTTIEEHINSLIYEKNLLFLHPYHYCKINSYFEFDEKEYIVDDCEKKKFFEKNYVCSSYNINHVLKTLIKIFLENDEKDDLVHLIYYKNKNNNDFMSLENNINIKKKIIRNKKFDFPIFPIYVVENYFFRNEYKEVYAYSSTENRKLDTENEESYKKEIDKENSDIINDNNIFKNKNMETKFKIYYTLPKHTNLKYIINLNLLNKNKEKYTDKNDVKKINSNKKVENQKKMKSDFLKYLRNNINTLSNNKLKDDFLHFILSFDFINFFNITKYFIKLSKIICEIKKNASVILLKNNLNHLEVNEAFNENVEINTCKDLEILNKKKNDIINIFNKSNEEGIICDSKNEKNKKALYLNNLSIRKINLNSLKNYPNLKELHLRNNNISNLKYFFHFYEDDLNNLLVLDLSCNNIVDLSSLYMKFKNLIHLNISFNYLYDYTQIIKFSKNHKKIEYLSILNNSIYIKSEFYSNIHFLFPKIKTFNDINIINKNNFDINNYYFATSNEEIFYDEYLLNNIPKNTNRKYVNIKDILNKKYSEIYKNINTKNYHNYIKIINLSNLYLPLNFLNFSNFENLKILNLSNNGIENLNDLKLPKKLKVLNLKNNKISSLEFLSDFLEIEKLVLDNNELKNINKIILLKKLKILRCSHNKITNLPLFQNLNLMELNIHNNLIKDITHLVLIKNKKSLISINIYNNKINFLNLDIYLIHIFPNLLILNNNYVEKKQNIQKFFKNIYTIDAFFDMYNLYPPYTSLLSLEINSLKIKNILFNINNDNFKNLISLNISNNYISNINNIGPLDNLKVLIMNNNKHINENSFIDENDNSTLNSFNSLEELDISHCLLSKTTFLKKCTNLKNLKILNLEGNNINTIKYLECFEKLKILNLSNNKISKICSNSFPNSLENLDISNNLIRSLSSFSTLKNVKKLDLRVNRIDNIDEFKYLKSLDNLKTLYLNGNRKIKEHFIIIKNMLNQIENFDNKIMKEQNSLTQYLEEKKEEANRQNKEINKTNISIDSNKNKSPNKDKTKMTKLKGITNKKDSFDDPIKKDSFTIIGKKVNSNGNY